MNPCSLQQFIEKANKQHNNKYDYSQVTYINAYTRVIIICPVHGMFTQRPNVHLHSKTGCSRCSAIARTKTTQMFIDQANIIHNNKYDYSKVVYQRVNKKVIVICPVHGEFLVTPCNHISLTSGCKKCANIILSGSLSRRKLKNCNVDNNKPTHVYCLLMFNNIEKFIKVGITTRKKISYRWPASLTISGYNIQVHSSSITTLEKALSLECKFQHTFKNIQYIPLQKFDGYTECFKYSEVV
jgi:hypothetical protein